MNDCFSGSQKRKRTVVNKAGDTMATHCLCLYAEAEIVAVALAPTEASAAATEQQQ